MELIITDGGKGLLAALPFVYPGIPTQRGRAHKTRNVLNHIRKVDHEAVKKDLAYPLITDTKLLMLLFF